MEKPSLRDVLATNIRAAATERGVGLNALADEAGVSRSQMYNVLAARTAASVDWLEKVAEALGVAPARLLHG